MLHGSFNFVKVLIERKHDFGKIVILDIFRSHFFYLLGKDANIKFYEKKSKD